MLYFQKGEIIMEDLTKKYYRENRALEKLKGVGKILKDISEGDLTPDETTACIVNLQMALLKELVLNTAIIADYCANHSIPDYPNKEERSKAGDSFKEFDS